MNDGELREILSDKPQGTQLNGAPADVTPPVDRGDIDLDEDRLSNYLLNSMKNDIMDRDQMNWTEKREYDLRAYHGIKDEYLSHVPWEGASNSPEHITTVLIDTGQSAVMGSIANDVMNMCKVTGIGKEDIKNSKKVESIMNWVVGTDMEDFYQEFDGNIHQVFKHGTSYFKVVVEMGNGEFKICPYTIPIERILLNIDARSPKAKDSDHIHQIIPWTANDLLYRKSLGAYKNLEYVDKGWSLKGNLTENQLSVIKNMTTGLDVTRKINRDTFFAVESYLTYYAKDSLKPLELIVWWTPASGKILRKRVNEDGVRPFADYFIYENYGYAYHQSLPEKIRNVQEDANYIKKQVTDAGDISISPPTFYEEGTNFDPNQALSVPSGMYPMKNAASIITKPSPNLPAMMERHKHIQEMWNAAERITGLTDVFQGMDSHTKMTLGSDLLRQKHADLRFNHLLKKINQGWKKTANNLYYYIDKYMPRNEKVKVLGTEEFSTIEQLFPLSNTESPNTSYGLQIGGKFDFNLAGKSVTDKDIDSKNQAMMADQILSDPAYMQDRGIRWKAYNAKADAIDFRGLEDIIPKPAEAMIFTPQEVINEIMSGNINILPNPSVDQAEYDVDIKMFMRTENFKMADPVKQQMFTRYLLIADVIRMAQMKAWQDFNVVEGLKGQMAMAGGQDMAMAGQGTGGNGSQPKPPGSLSQEMPPAPPPIR